MEGAKEEKKISEINEKGQGNESTPPLNEYLNTFAFQLFPHVQI
jgi:hypothetical protein